MTNTKIPLLTIPLGTEAHRFARQFAAQQATPQKGKRVYFNTLAVYAVHCYLRWLEIETNLNESDSWHPGKGAILNVADLALPGIGKLECRPVLPGESSVELPPEVTENRIGYVGVQFDESLTEVQLLGFAPAADTVNPPEELQIADFQPLDVLIDYIHQLKDVQKAIALKGAEKPRPLLINLSRWLENLFEGGWQSQNAFLDTANLAWNLRYRMDWNVRSAIQLGGGKLEEPTTFVAGIKLVDLGVQLAGLPVALVVTFMPEVKYNTILQVHSMGSEILPEDIRLTVFDESGTTFLEAKARRADNFIQLMFKGNPGERFSVQIALDVASITEDFVI
ncbi:MULTISPECIES: DUF1822 family protein [unclassified Coleofasciculus]|uniref:DUF1822 family protein n=1 Tax=unclassified Coleofasciculus TaxID=2692782 RepID=UPI0018807F3F|nr:MULTISPECIES: DUF1822 family protein [unclassified Coleofasciculus]MBE9130050.1 DUF1822 family protein [Coleofasciculus sp. LEGE 07081]MBE9152409.1 DUF1822 family protein [Coleofasciculus sp. LEGE 07092]